MPGMAVDCCLPIRLTGPQRARASSAVTFLELLSRPARTGIVSTDLSQRVMDRSSFRRLYELRDVHVVLLKRRCAKEIPFLILFFEVSTRLLAPCFAG